MTFAPSFDHSRLLQSSSSMPVASEKIALKYQPDELKFHTKSPGDLATRVASYLRSIHPRKTAEEASALTGMSTQTIKTWLHGTSCPGGVALVRLIMTYGPDMLAAVCPTPPAWLDKAARDQRTAALEQDIADKRRQIEALRR